MGLLVERTKRMRFFQRISYHDIGFANLVFVPQMPVCFQIGTRALSAKKTHGASRGENEADAVFPTNKLSRHRLCQSCFCTANAGLFSDRNAGLEREENSWGFSWRERSGCGFSNE